MSNMIAACKPVPIMSSPDTQELFNDVAGLYDEAPVPPLPPPSPWPDSGQLEELSKHNRRRSNSKHTAKGTVKKAIRRFKSARHTLALVEAGSEATGSGPISWAAELDGLHRRKEAQTDRLSEAERTLRFARRKVYWVKEERKLAKQAAKSAHETLIEYRRLYSARCRYSTAQREYLHDIRVRARLGYVD
jgi:uncharacterized NAD(P)/FAD-binding protein YdhS